MLAQAAVRRVARNEVILRRGDPSSGANIIVIGPRADQHHLRGRQEVTLGVLGPGDVLGEMSVLDGEDVQRRRHRHRGLHAAGHRARRSCAFCAPAALCLRLMAVLCRRIRRANAALEDMALLDLAARLGAAAAAAGDDYGAPVRAGTRIEVKLSQKTSAPWSALAREGEPADSRSGRRTACSAKDSGRMVILRRRARHGRLAVVIRSGERGDGPPALSGAASRVHLARTISRTGVRKLRLASGLTLFTYVTPAPAQSFARQHLRRRPRKPACWCRN